MNYDPKINIKTDVLAKGVIETTETINDRITKFIMNTRDKQTREALILLGWTPPKD